MESNYMLTSIVEEDDWLSRCEANLDALMSRANPTISTSTLLPRSKAMYSLARLADAATDLDTVR
jgi:hypothetical protein